MQLVVLFSIPQYNWDDLQVAYKNLNETPITRGVERSGIKLTQPCVFKAVFKDRDMDCHISISFLIYVPTTLSSEFKEKLFMITSHKLLSTDIGVDLLLATGTLYNWKQALERLDKLDQIHYNDITRQLKAYIRKFEA